MRIRKRHIAASLAGLGVAWTSWTVYDAISMRPGPATDYGLMLYERALERQGVTPDGFTPSENGWGDFVAAINAVQGVLRAGDNRVATKWPGESLDLAILRGDGTYRADRADELYLAAVDTVRAIRDMGADEQLDRALSARVLTRDRPTGGLLNILLPELGPARSTARYIAADIALASLEGDTARCVRQFDRGLRIGDLFNHRWCLIESLVGMAIDTLIMGEMGRELAEREFTEADLEGILRAIDRHPEIDVEYFIGNERLTIRSFLQDIYTDDGAGDGRLILSRYAQLASAWGAVGGVGIPRQLGPVANVGSGLFASKKEAIARADALYDATAQFAMTPPWRRVGPPVDAEDGPLEMTSLKYRPLAMFVPSLTGPTRSIDTLQCHRAGLVTLAAVELYRVRNGRLPESLAELVPGVIAELPIDPYTGEPLVYRLAEAGDPSAPRGFILYSVGPDLTDDGGDFRGKSSWNGEWQHAWQVYNPEAPLDRAYHMPREPAKVEDEFANEAEWTPPPIPPGNQKASPGQPQ